MEAIELTHKLVVIESMNPGGDEHDCALFLGELLADHGFDVSYHEFALQSLFRRAYRYGAPRHPSLVGGPVCRRDT